jgi:predicted permease
MNWRGKRLLNDLDDEIRQHIELATQDNVDRGMSPEEARYAAMQKFGNVTLVKEDAREVWAIAWFEQFRQDLRFAFRQLRKSPGFAAVAILTLALGIGANTAIFTVVQAVLLAPLPFRQPDRLVLVMQRNPINKHMMDSSYPDFLDWRRDARSFEQMSAMSWHDYNLSSPGIAERVNGKGISAGFFDTLGVRLSVGREFTAKEDRSGGAPSVIISHRLWTDRFNGSPKVIGSSVALSGVTYTVVGVLPSGFRFIEDTDVYTPIAQGDPLIMNDRTMHPVLCVARLKARVTLVQAQGEMSSIQDSLNRLYPSADQELGSIVSPLKKELIADVSTTLLLLLGAVGIVLLIACANLTNLLLARSTARTREFAVRTALGAKPARLVRQLITESVVLSLAGGTLGLAFAKWGLKAVLAAVPGGLPRGESIGVNVAVLTFTFVVSLVVAIIFGLAPALKFAHTDPQVSLKAGSRGLTGSYPRAQSALVVVQMALTLVLLTGAGLLFRTIRQLWEVNPGFDARHILTFKVGLSPSATKEPAELRVAYQNLLQRVREIPGVEGTDLTVLVPLSQQTNMGPFWPNVQPPASVAAAPRALFYWTGPDFLKTMRIPLLRGTYFTAQDTTETERVAVIDSVLAHAYFPYTDPIGQSLNIPHWGVARIIGVVAHVKHWNLGDQQNYTDNQIYASLYQLPDEWASFFYQNVTVAVRTGLDQASLVPAIKAAVSGNGSDQPVYDIRAMEEMVSQSMAAQRFPMILLGVFAGLALLMASIGIYGVISYTVAQRVPEIGIRMALGAPKSQIFRMVIGHGLLLGFAGFAVGGAATLILFRVLSGFSRLLYGVGASDPVTFAAVFLLLIGVALLASYLPARRAARVDPMVALRYE